MTDTPSGPQPLVVLITSTPNLLASTLWPYIQAILDQTFRVLVLASPDDRAFALLDARGVTCEPLPIGQHLSPLRDSASWILIASALIQRRPLMVQSLNAHLHLPTALAAKFARVPISTCAMFDGLSPLPPSLPHSLQTKALHAYGTQLAQHTDACIVFNTQDETKASTRLNIPPSLLHSCPGFPGVDLNHLSLETRPDQNKDAARASLQFPEGKDFWVGLFPTSIDDVTPILTTLSLLPNIQTARIGFVLLSSGPLTNTSKLRSAFPPSSLIIAQNRKDSELPLWLSALDLALEPLLNPPLNPLLFAAAAMRLPIVAIDSPFTHDAVQHERTGLLLPPTSAPQAILDAAISLLRNSPKRRMMGVAASIHARSMFDAERLRFQLFSLYDTLSQEKVTTAPDSP